MQRIHLDSPLHPAEKIMTTVLYTDHSGDTPPTLPERRRHPRHLCNRVCFARPNGTATGMTWGVVLWDISVIGLSIILNCELQPGMVVAIQPFREDDSAGLFACVVRTQRLSEGRWLYGCVFPEPLSASEFEFWVRRTTPDSFARDPETSPKLCADRH